MDIKNKLIKLLVLITGIYLIYYLYWRITYTINPKAVWFSWILLVCEIQGVINFFLFAMMTYNIKPIRAKMLNKATNVDVFIPTYNEEIEVLEATVIGAINMNLEHKTYILDDGRRQEVKKLANEYGCIYLTRENNLHAKAGNINAALKNSSGEFIVVLDADMVPQPDFLEKTLGYFEDELVAIVQTPQEFYNTDSVQYQDDEMHWHEQQLFYHVIQPGKNNINAAFWCGSPSIVRRKALVDVGGVATESITEDFLTSIKLNSKGWKIRYHKEVLAFGIAPQSLFAFNLQRLRWAQGSMKILKSRFNPLIIKGLSIKQRLSHFSAIFTYFDAYQKLIYFILPSIFLFTNILPIKEGTGLTFILHWAPYYLLSMITNIALGRGYFKYFSVELFNTLKMITFIKASLTLIQTKVLSFKVTPKSVDDSIKGKERRELRAQLIILLFVIISILIGFVNNIFEVYITYSSLATFLIAIFWSSFNAIMLIYSIRYVLKRLYFRKDYRFSAELSAYITDNRDEDYSIKIEDISRTGLGITLPKDLEIESVKLVHLFLPNGKLTLSGNVVYKRKADDGITKMGIKFRDLEHSEKMKLYNYLFVTLPRLKFKERRIS